MIRPSVSAVVVTYNSQKYIKDCIEALLKSKYPLSEIIVVDNNSSDDTKDILKKYSSKLTLKFLSKNVGYAEGNNIGVKLAKSKYIFILNPDTTVTPGFLEPLVKTLESDNSFAVCQPAVYLTQQKDKLNLTGKVTHFLGFDWIRDYKKKVPSEGKELDSFSGCALLVSKDIFEKVGGYDDYYFMYYEDSDLSWRLRLQGFKIVFVPESNVYHDYKYIPEESYQPLRQKMFYIERNRVITIIKNYSTGTLILLTPLIILIELAMIGYFVLQGIGKEKIKGYQQIIRDRELIFKQRQKVQRARSTSDKMITKNFKSQIDFVFFKNPLVTYLLNPLMISYWWVVKKFL